MEEVKKMSLESKVMQSTYFLYWLQGLFEIGEIKTLSKKQVLIIQEHIKITIKDHPFISWLDGFLQSQNNGVNKELTALIKIKLSESFVNITAPKNIFDELLKPSSPWDRPSPIRSPWDRFSLSDKIIC